MGSGKPIGLLVGVAVKEEYFGQIFSDIYTLKVKHFGQDIAKRMEIKGSDLFKSFVFKLEKRGVKSKNLSFADDLLDYITFKNLIVLGCVCFEEELHEFKCEDVRALDKTFFYVFERVDVFMKREHPDRMVKLIFDDRGFQINKTNSEAITNFFVRSPAGLALTSVIKTPLFAVSQAQNIGLQLADFVNYIIGSRFVSDEKIDPYWKKLKRTFYRWPGAEGYIGSSLKILRG